MINPVIVIVVIVKRRVSPDWTQTRLRTRYEREIEELILVEVIELTHGLTTITAQTQDRPDIMKGESRPPPRSHLMAPADCDDVQEVIERMSAVSHTMRTPTLQPVPESLPVADHVTNSKSVKSKVKSPHLSCQQHKD